MSYSIYFPVIQYPNMIELTLQQLVRIDRVTPFQKCYLVADAADAEVCALAMKIVSEGYEGITGERFVFQWYPERQGPSKCLNKTITQLGPEEDLLVVTHALCDPTLVLRMQHVAYQHTLSSHIGVVNASEVELEPNVRDQYLQLVYEWVKSGITMSELRYQIYDRFFLKYRDDEIRSPLETDLGHINTIQKTGELGGIFYIKHLCFEKIGYFDEQLCFKGEEWDYNSRMTMAGLLTVFPEGILSWPIARGIIYGRMTPDDFAQATRRMEEKYHGPESEVWENVQGFECRRLAPKIHTVVAQGQTYPMLHSTR